jgi:hypothetical protein
MGCWNLRVGHRILERVQARFGEWQVMDGATLALLNNRDVQLASWRLAWPHLSLPPCVSMRVPMRMKDFLPLRCLCCACASVLRSIKTFTNEIDGFVRQARRKPEQYRVVLRGFATQHDGQRRDFM